MGVKIGFVGNGLISWAHILSIKALQKAKLVEIDSIANYDVDQTKAENFATANNSFRASDLDELLKNCDLVWICTPTKYHKELIDAAIKEVSGIFCEKPLGINLNEVIQIKKAVETSNIYFQVGLVLRTAPVFLEIRKMVQEQTYGLPLAVSLIDDQFFPVQGHYGSTWRADYLQAGGGTLIEHSIHDVDILRFCFGDFKRIAGFVSNHYNYENVEDVASCSFGHQTNINSTLLSVWHQIISRGSTRRMQVFTTEAVIITDDDFLGPIKVITKEKTQEIVPKYPDYFNDLDLPTNQIGLAVKMYCSENLNFINGYLNKYRPSPNVQDAHYAHWVVDQIYHFNKNFADK